MQEEEDMPARNTSPMQRWIRTPSGLILLGFLAIAAFFLITEHWAHVLGVVPYALLLLCPVLHLFLHRSHGSGHGEHHGPEQGDGR
jgi:hypothetical protein